MDRFAKAINPLFAVFRWTTVVLLSVMVVVESYEISLRSITGDTPAWSKELVLLSMVWMGCLGSAVLHRERGHITLEFLVDFVFPKKRRWILLGVDLLILVFSVFLLLAGSVVAKEFMGQSLPGTGIPVGVSYIPLPLTGLLLVLAALEHILADIRGRPDEAADAC